MAIAHPGSPSHYSGWLAFGPDGYLYLSTGDGGGPGDPHDNAQNTDSLLGKILRLDPRDPDGSGPRRFSIPADNPYVGFPGRDLIWSIGVRNPWRNAFDAATGDLWVADVGQERYEEINHLLGPQAGRGANLGWDLCEGTHAYPDDSTPCALPGSVAPVAEFAHVVADGEPNCAVIGGSVYHPPGAAHDQDAYVFGDLCSGRIWALPASTSAFVEQLPEPLDTSLTITAFGEDATGGLYVLDYGGSVWSLNIQPN